MDRNVNIIIGDESALFFHLHCDGPRQVGAEPFWGNPLDHCFASSTEMGHINTGHPLYGGEPVSLLVPRVSTRRRSKRLNCRCCPDELPEKSFFKLRDGLFIATPELVYARMGKFMTEMQLAEVGINLCGRYYINASTKEIEDRHFELATPESLATYLAKSGNMRGAGKAENALRWVIPNSGSPIETKMYLQYCTPLWCGGFALPFTHMNYDISAKRLARMTEQNDFCLDLANPDRFAAMEYDGGDAHTDTSKDLRRRNALKALGWNVFVLDKTVLYNADATVKAGLQVARHLGIRLQFPACWEKKFVKLRIDLGLPI